MCVIFHLKKGQMIQKSMLENAVYNNWHSYGIVMPVDGKLDIIKKVPESGEVDPEEVYKILQDNFDVDRFVHLRHNTAGATSIENTHPFEVYFNEASGTHVVFMHNGTMYEYKSRKTTPSGGFVDDDDGPSDTKNFVDDILIPYTSGTDFGHGKGDISSPLFRNLIKKMWPAGQNRGLLISSKADPFFIDTWVEVGEHDEKFKSSNDDYFKLVKRGPEYDRRKAEEDRLKKEQDLKNSKIKKGGLKSSTSVPIRPFREFDLTKKHDFFSLSESTRNICNDFDVYDRTGLVSLGYMDTKEIEELYSSKADCVAIMDYAFTDYAKLYEEHCELEDKHSRASKHIATLVEELKALKESKKEQKAA